MSSPSRSRSQSPARWDPSKIERGSDKIGKVSIERRRGQIRLQRLPPGRLRRSYSSDDNCTVPSYSNNVERTDVVPEFDPEKGLSAIQWLNKIEQLASIHGWNDTVKCFHMRSRLVGAAKKWYNALRNYEFSWSEWKQKILEAFRQDTDYAEVLREMLERRKGPHETITHYFYSKCQLLTKCDIKEEKAVSCIIDGLPFHMKNAARAGNYKSPEELYSDFFCDNDDDTKTYSPRPRMKSYVTYSGKRVSREEVPDWRPKKTLICFLCNETGHIVRGCPKNQIVAKFNDCSKTGQKIEECCKEPDNSKEQDSKDIKIERDSSE